MLKKGICIKFDKKNERHFFGIFNNKMNPYILVIALLETLNDICKYHNLNLKEQIDNYLELGSCDNYKE